MIESADPAERAMILSEDGWGRIIALIAAADGDISGAEDALSTALERAVTAWRAHGPPAKKHPGEQVVEEIDPTEREYLSVGLT